MKITKLFEKDGKSYFTEIDCGFVFQHPLGMYSEKYPTKSLTFRTFKPGLTFDWHTAPEKQYIVYLEGEVEVTASSGETRIFKPGDILLAADLTGQGHVTKTLTEGRSIIITVL